MGNRPLIGSKVKEVLRIFETRPEISKECKEFADNLFCPECMKPVPHHTPNDAYTCLFRMAMKERRKFEESLTKNLQ
jgi:hypothetical protein